MEDILKKITSSFSIKTNNIFHKEVFQDENEYKTFVNKFVDTFSEFTRDTKRFGQIKIEMEWIRLANIVIDSNGNESPKLVNIPVDVTYYLTHDLFINHKEHVMGYYLEMIIYDIFLIANLSHPGSLSIYKLELLIDETYSIIFENEPLIFGMIIQPRGSIKWLNNFKIDLSVVSNWYNSFNLIEKQLSTSNLERCLYAMLNLTASYRIGPLSIIWLTLALESIYNLPKSSICKTLLNRICLVFDSSLEEEKQIKKIVSNFYDHRSRIVHGDFDICHPSLNELLDEELDGYIGKIFQKEAIVSNILVVTLQKMILKNSKKLCFKESISYY